jgi:lysophospholipase L1-like esterase
MRLAILVLPLVAVVACGEDAPANPGDAQPDASVRPDAGAEPLPVREAGASIDSSTVDASLVPDSSIPNTTACLYQGFSSLPSVAPNYEQFAPIVNASCTGTNHQNIAGVEKVVFLGDSITAGSPPSLPAQFYRTKLGDMLKQRFGAAVEIASCAEWGGATEDFFRGQKQIEKCFPAGVETKRTLIVMTMGGNDVGAWAKRALSTSDAMALAETALLDLRAGIDWLQDPAHFPGGSFVVFANPYEFTDGTGEVRSCAAARLSGFDNNWPQGIPVVKRLEEGYMKIAVETKTDMMFLFDSFCGHGYKNDDPQAPCYRGPGAERWFDATCYHPNPKGHGEIAKAFLSVISE